MKILIAGATGMIGQALIAAWKKQYDITVLGRDRAKLQKYFPHLKKITWGKLDAVAGFDVVLNLAGANIGQGRWTTKRKQIIIQSRLQTTQRLVKWCINTANPPRLLNASAIGVYGLPKATTEQKQHVFDEQSPVPDPPQDFLAAVGIAWEQALLKAEQAGVPVIKMRFGVVLAEHGGALAKMLPIFKLGLGGPIGTGEQPFSWVGLSDVVRALTFLLDHRELTGPINIVAPEILSQRQFANTLGRVLHRPTMIRLPAWLVKALFGQMGEELLLNGITVQAKKLSQAGFTFAHDTLEQALIDRKTHQ